MPPEAHLVDSLPLLLWRLITPCRAISSGPLGGGIDVRHWVLNATVDADYTRTDPAAHLRELASRLGLAGAGVGLLTAVDVREAVTVEHEGAVATATTGVGHPTWAVRKTPEQEASAQEIPAPNSAALPDGAGTVNIVVQCPVALTEAALVNVVGTVTEAKTQALLTYGIAGTGTATDTVTVLCPPERGGAEDFAGVRSPWGARTASAVYAAVYVGLVRDRRQARRSGY